MAQVAVGFFENTVAGKITELWVAVLAGSGKPTALKYIHCYSPLLKSIPSSIHCKDT